jgi:hypothetical protein
MIEGGAEDGARQAHQQYDPEGIHHERLEHRAPQDSSNLPRDPTVPRDRRDVALTIGGKR